MSRKGRFWSIQRFLILLITLLVLYFVFRWGWNLRGKAEAVGCYNLPENAYPMDWVEGDNLHLIVLGDQGMGTDAQREVAQGIAQLCKTKKCDLAILTGDNFYQEGLVSTEDPQFAVNFQEIYQGVDLPFYAVLGNHDLRGHSASQIYLGLKDSKWHMPNYNYEFKAGPAHLAFYNSSCPLGAMDWLPQSLDESESPWKILIGHHPLYSTGKHGDAPWYAQILWNWTIGTKVDFYLSGHDHVLNLAQQQGEQTLHVVSGSGAESYPDSVPIHQSSAKNLFHYKKPGFAYLELTKTKAILEFYDSKANLLFSKTVPKKSKK